MYIEIICYRQKPSNNFGNHLNNIKILVVFGLHHFHIINSIGHRAGESLVPCLFTAVHFTALYNLYSIRFSP